MHCTQWWLKQQQQQSVAAVVVVPMLPSLLWRFLPINKKIICLFNNTAILTIFSDRSPSPLIWQFPNSLLEEESESETIGGEWEYKARACGKLMLLLIFCSCSRRKEQWKRQWSERRRRGHRTSGLEAAECVSAGVETVQGRGYGVAEREKEKDSL